MLEKSFRNGLRAPTPYICVRCLLLQSCAPGLSSAIARNQQYRTYAEAATPTEPNTPNESLFRIRKIEKDNNTNRRNGKNSTTDALRRYAVASETDSAEIQPSQQGAKAYIASSQQKHAEPNPQTDDDATTIRKYPSVPKVKLKPKAKAKPLLPLRRHASKNLRKVKGDSNKLQRLHKEVPAVSNNTSHADKSQPRGPGRRRRRVQAPSNVDSKDAKPVPEETKSIQARSLSLSVIDVAQPDVPRLAYGLDRVLFNPGVYHMRDERSGVYNFDPFLEKITPLQKFDFSNLNRFTPSSQDSVLSTIASEAGKKFIGSTSSMTGVLKHFHFQLSRWREITTSMLSRRFPVKMSSFTKLTRAPDAIFLRYNNGTYAVDSDKMYDGANVLSLMGRYMEKLLTLDKDTFQRYEKGSANPIGEDERASTESFHYSTIGDFVLRSQLDAYDTRLPGTGMFDLKTRAVVPIRMDSKNYEWGMGYEIRSDHGEYFSFEREYYDMLRSTLLKYSLQARIGRMDGIFVAYHNISRMFGFQYLSLEEMDEALHGQRKRLLGDQEFLSSLEILNVVLNQAVERFPKTSIRLHFESREARDPFMYIFAEPVTEDRADAIQTTNKEKIEKWEEAILAAEPAKVQPAVAMTAEETNEDFVESSSTPSETEHISTENTMPVDGSQQATSDSTGDETLTSEVDENTVFIPFGWTADGITVQFERGGDSLMRVVRHARNVYAVLGDVDSVESSREGTDIVVDANTLRAVDNYPDKPHVIRSIFATRSDKSSTAANAKASGNAKLSSTLDSTANLETPAEAAPATQNGPLLALILTTRSKLNGLNVDRPWDLEEDDKWDIEYSISEVANPDRARKLYEACVKRRRDVYDTAKDDANRKEDFFMRKLKEMTEISRQRRVEADEQEAKMKEDGAQESVRMWDDETHPPATQGKSASA